MSNNFSSLISEMQFRFKETNNLSISTQLSAILRSKLWSQNLLGTDMFSSLVKEVARHHKRFSTSSDISLSIQHLNRIPSSVVDSISLIHQQHSMILGQWKNISQTNSSHSIDSMNSWKFALNTLSSQVATISIVEQKWDLIDDFKEITTDVSNIQERILERELISKSDFIELKNLVEKIEFSINKHSDNFVLVIYKYLFIIYAIVFLLTKIDTYINPTEITRAELEKSKVEILTLIQTKIYEHKDYRTTIRPSKVFVKPQAKSRVVTRLEKGFDVTVLQVNHKWVFITYLNPSDNLPESGWIMKKYLSKTKSLN